MTKLVHMCGTDAVLREGANMVKEIMSTALLCSLFLWQMLSLAIAVDGGEQQLPLKYKTLAIETKKDYPIGDFTLSIADINNDQKNEIAISGNGYLRIFEWNGKTFEPKWRSAQFSHQVIGSLFFYEISPLVTAHYYIDKKLSADYLFFAYTKPKSGPIAADTYKLSSKMNKYNSQKMSLSPFNRFDIAGECSDGSSMIIGRKSDKGNIFTVIYGWNGSELIEKRHGPYRTRIVTSGDILNAMGKIENVFLVQDDKQTGFLSCASGSIEWKEVNIDTHAKELMRTNRIDTANGRIGITRRDSLGELWTVQYSEIDNDYSTKLYMSQYDGKKFSPLSRVVFQGVNPNMIYKVIINDVDNDGVGEILGVEEEIRKTIPRKPQPGDTGEESNALLITSNLFLAKWNGKEYEVKWHRKAIDEKVRNIALGDVVGNGKKEIVVTDDNGYLYVFDMPNDK